MPSLQAHKRSLSQQALADLQAIVGGDPRHRRRRVLDRLPNAGPAPHRGAPPSATSCWL